MEKYDIELIKNSVVAFNITKSYPTAVKDTEIVDLNDIINHKSKYKDRYNPKGRLRSDVLTAELFLLSGKENINIYRRGQRLAYIKQFEQWKELGCESWDEFLEHLPFNTTTVYHSIFIAMNFDEDTCIKLGSKLSLIPQYLLEELSNKERTKILKDIADMSYSETREYIRELVTPERPTRKRLPDQEKINETIELHGGSDDYESYNINIRPRIKTQDNGRDLILSFPSRVVGEVCTIAYRQLEQRILDMIGRKVQDLLSKEEYSNYRKKLIK